MIAVRTQALPEGQTLPQRGLDELALDGLRDELHSWGMASAGAVSAAYCRMADVRSDLRHEIAAPLRAVADVLGGDALERLDWTLADPRSHP